jgi:sugar phosphate isomerase/epimerase
MADARLALSNLAWLPENDSEILPKLADLGVRGIEVAPTRLGDWSALTPAILAAYRNRLADCGLTISSLQALMFGVEGAQLIGTATEFDVFRNHIARVLEIGQALGAEVAVFGSPRNRLLNGQSSSVAQQLAIERLALLAPAFSDAGMVLGIEPVPAYYGGEFLSRADDVAALVVQVDAAAIRLHLDTGCVHLGGDDIGAMVTRHHAVLAHFHIAEPDLAGFSAPVTDHAGAAASLLATGYDRWISIEMKPQPPQVQDAIERAILHAKRVYSVGQ